MVGLDTDRFEAVAFTGYHSGAGCSGNPLSHTMHRFVEEIRLNGESVSEFVINALIAAYYHIPVVFLSGDKALCEYAEGMDSWHYHCGHQHGPWLFYHFY